MMYIYHYYAELPKALRVESWDGIITRRKPIESMEDYSELKKFLLEYFKEDRGTKIIIKSISLVSKREADA